MRECCIVLLRVIGFSLHSSLFWNHYCHRNFLMLQTSSWQLVRTYHDVTRMMWVIYSSNNNNNSQWLQVNWPKQSMSKHSEIVTKSIMYLAVTATHELMKTWNNFSKLRESWVLSKSFLQYKMIITEFIKLSRYLSLYRIKTWRWKSFLFRHFSEIV